MKPNAEPLAEILRRLNPRQEKVVRLYFGLGCKRSHSVAEMAEEFTVAPAVIHRILSAAKKRLVEAGVTS